MQPLTSVDPYSKLDSPKGNVQKKNEQEDEESQKQGLWRGRITEGQFINVESVSWQMKVFEKAIIVFGVHKKDEPIGSIQLPQDLDNS